MTDVEDIQLPPELSNLSTIVDASPEVLATGSSDLQSTALNATKFIYDLGKYTMPLDARFFNQP